MYFCEPQGYMTGNLVLSIGSRLVNRSEERDQDRPPPAKNNQTNKKQTKKNTTHTHNKKNCAPWFGDQNVGGDHLRNTHNLGAHYLEHEGRGSRM